MAEPVARTRKPTMIDVARRAGVSHMTVSRFLRDDPTIREENRSRIEAAIAELDYRPNIVARSMRIRRTGLLSIVVPATVNAYSSARIISAATLEAHEAGFEVEIVHVSGGSGARTRRALELADSQLVEGVLSVAALDLDDGRVLPVGQVPVVAVADYDDDLQGAGVLLDASPIGEIVRGLAERGHRHLFHVGGPVGHPASEERVRAYERAVVDLGLESHGVWREDWSGETGRRAVRSLPIDSPVTALVCVNDELAAGAMEAAAERGWAVPERVSVTGWDNSPVGARMPPGLTSVFVDHEMLGRRAMRRLIAVVRGEEAPSEDLSALNTVIWRGSVGAIA